MMNLTQPEKRRVRVSSGTLPSPKITALAPFHPFSKQLDVVLPFESDLSGYLEKLETSYGKARVKLSDVLKNAETFVSIVGGRYADAFRKLILVGTANYVGLFFFLCSDFLVVSMNLAQEEDVWCIDTRGHLTLSVSKSTYERLGLVGQKLPFRNHEEHHGMFPIFVVVNFCLICSRLFWFCVVIDIPLQKYALSPANREKIRACIELWDKRRESELGKDAALWEVLYSWKGQKEPYNFPFAQHDIRTVQCTKRQQQDVHIPQPCLSPRPDTSSSNSSSKKSKLTENKKEDMLEDWNRRTESLFEWVGMACLGAQRLQANDRADPFVALYEPPEPSIVGNVIHLQWRGLLHHDFVQQVINSVFPSLLAPKATIPFISITCHALTSSPVSYIPYVHTPSGDLQTPESVPAKLPRLDGEDTWSLILERGKYQAGGSARWCLTESLGPCDTRWG
ncbi:ribonuclease P 40kDa subunit-domain-containing protein [Gymnopilus junonius]|uniref:Ribonuclease P 40kDa subunit-domain-containing protein n=1 Tax=Gymnopilus junonius TaxID=109634 RepID=A0A9P5TFI6_GYMJU|nr:ribonuclease P 40kDa subunit-domain-containing protein [Gymnopilus junonius]